MLDDDHSWVLELVMEKYLDVGACGASQRGGGGARSHGVGQVGYRD